MTKSESMEKFTDESLMPFGKYKGQPLIKVSASYQMIPTEKK